MKRFSTAEVSQSSHASDKSNSNSNASQEDDLDENFHDAKSSLPPQEWAEFLHIPGKKFTDFEQVREEILKDTARISGANSGISPVPIRLRLYSPNVLTLTLIDLPGITRNPIGDQPADIEFQVRKLCENYCSNPNAVILAVTAANTDLANSDGLNVARKVDPKGERTIGVITKLDLMDEGTDASDILEGKVIYLEKGYIGVVNRSQKDINSRASVDYARKKEAEFFKKHPVYDESKMGTAFLTQKLSQILHQHIKDCLPGLRIDLNDRLLKTESALKSLGVTPFDSIDMHNSYSNGADIDDDETGYLNKDDHKMSEIMLNMITKFSKNFSNAIDGKYFDTDFSSYNYNDTTKGKIVTVDELVGGAKIGHIFTNEFAQHLRSISPFYNLSDHDIKKAILYTMGTKKALFVPEESFDHLVRKQVGWFESPCVHCATKVHAELTKLAKFSSQTHLASLSRFPTLSNKILEVVTTMLNRQLKPTLQFIKNIIGIEQAFVNTANPEFVSGSGAIEGLMRRQSPKNKQLQSKAQNLNMEFASDAGFSEDDVEENTHANVNAASGSQHIYNRGLAPVLTESQNASANESTAGNGGTFMNFLFNKGNQTQNQPNPATFNAATSYSKQSNSSSASPNSNVDKDFETFHAQEQLQQQATVPSAPAVTNSRRNLASGALNFVSVEDNNEVEVEIIKELMQSYLQIVKKNIEDLVPKTVMFFLVNYARDNVQNELVREVYNNRNEYSAYLKEDPNVAVERERLKKVKRMLVQALEAVGQVDDFKMKY